MAEHDEPTKDASAEPKPVRPEVRWPDEGQLTYRAAADDHRDWRSEHSKAFKGQMWAGLGVGIVAVVLWVMTNIGTQGNSFKPVTLLFGSLVVAWAAGSIAKYRTGGFVVGLILAVVTTLMITGCGVALICSGAFR